MPYDFHVNAYRSLSVKAGTSHCNEEDVSDTTFAGAKKTRDLVNIQIREFKL